MHEQKSPIDLISSTISVKSSFDRSSIKSLMRCIDTQSQLTYGRTDIVVPLATAMGNHFRLAIPEMEELIVAVLFCDIGMWAISDSIIYKKGRLTLEEFKIVQKHPEYALNALKDTNLSEMTKKAILNHHEKHDGTGYPNRLNGKAIASVSQIVNAVTSIYAITAQRAYREAMSVEKAVEIVKAEENLQFHPDIVKAVLELHSKEEIAGIINQSIKDPFRSDIEESEHKNPQSQAHTKKFFGKYDPSDESHLKAEETITSLRKIVGNDSENN